MARVFRSSLSMRTTTPSPPARDAAYAHLRGYLRGAVVLWALCGSTRAHERHGSLTYEISAPASLKPDEKRLRLTIVDSKSGAATAARFTLEIDDREFIPDLLGADGLRFTTIRAQPRQRYVV